MIYIRKDENKKMILITGGGGYIGSNVARLLLQQGKEIVIVDQEETPRIAELRKYGNFVFIQSDISDIEILFKNSSQPIDTVIHFAAYLSVPESVKEPLKYYLNNTAKTAKLVSWCVKYNVKKFIFSSTAAVYGTSDVPVNEESKLSPDNPYGKSKLMSEEILRDACYSSNLKCIVLRYFNVAGCEVENGVPILGHNANGKHLIKKAAEAACGKIPHLDIYGTDYPTPDGTGVRDYIHVVDLAEAHIKALDDDLVFEIYNVGYNKGYSVLEIIDRMQQKSGQPIVGIPLPRRAGDPACVVADNRHIVERHGDFFRYDIDEICFSSYLWEKNL